VITIAVIYFCAGESVGVWGRLGLAWCVLAFAFWKTRSFFFFLFFFFFFLFFYILCGYGPKEDSFLYQFVIIMYFEGFKL
jgi:hypothetical protein